MDQGLQFLITTSVGILLFFVGRASEKFNRQSKKDKEQIKKIIKVVPIESDSLNFLRNHDFGSSYRDGKLDPFWELRRILSQPSYFFINNKLEKAKIELQKELTDFEELIETNVFVSDRNTNFWELARPNNVIGETVLVKRNRGEEMSDEEVAQLEKEVWDDHNKTKQKLNLIAGNICKKYDFLMSTAHRIL